ncbi:GNAT family N-acetyltransferase [Paenibacillus chibensis]|uniref:GNAT family N-acetyltransferase n=1 Tax=Paenibacillus chibensis TaxID=59846 RepID=A0ABU6PRS2_9BACL|nr:GNAT family N-acetyltransferase [Paenibacillus chibensis]
MQVDSLHEYPRNEWSRQQARVLRFMFEHGGKQALHKDYVKLACATESILQQTGTSLLTATVRGEAGPFLIGASYAQNFGSDAFLIAVHPLYRRRGIGSRLMAEQMAQLGHIQCSAGLKQIPFLGMCFRAGLTASAMVQEQPGRYVLNLIGENNNPVRLQAVPSEEGEMMCRFPS